jgi:hypothetical protein
MPCSAFLDKAIYRNAFSTKESALPFRLIKGTVLLAIFLREWLAGFPKPFQAPVLVLWASDALS